MVSPAKIFLDLIADITKQVEETIAPDWVLLEGFPRSLQLDSYSCGAQCAFAVLKFYGKARSIRNITRELGTDIDGTGSTQLRKLFSKRGLWPVILRVPTVKSLKKEIDRGHPIIVSMEGDHWALVYGYGNRCIFISDPSVIRAPLCRHSTKKFQKRWDKWALAIRDR